jgi:hypothetical protein
MKYRTNRRPFTAWILIVLLFFLGFGGIVSGALLFSAPDGRLMGMSVDLLKGSPFPNFLIPGLILFLFVGVFQLFVGYGLVTHGTWNGPDIINPFKGYHWAWTASWVAGVIMLIWIIVETVLLGYISILQPIILIWGLIIITLTLLPNVRHYYKRKA